MRDIALVPQCDVLERSLGIGPDDAGQTADLLTIDGIALVWHRRRALLLLAEELFCLANLGALQVTNLGGDPVQGAGDYGESGNVVGMAVPLNYLRSYGCDTQ